MFVATQSLSPLSLLLPFECANSTHFTSCPCEKSERSACKHCIPHQRGYLRSSGICFLLLERIRNAGPGFRTSSPLLSSCQSTGNQKPETEPFVDEFILWFDIKQSIEWWSSAWRLPTHSQQDFWSCDFEVNIYTGSKLWAAIIRYWRKFAFFSWTYNPHVFIVEV